MTGSGATATVVWTTDESSTSSVDYGTTTALGSSATGATGTSHSVALTGLEPNTRYYYPVTSVDAATNSVTSPASPAVPPSYLPTVSPMAQTTTADFTAGSNMNTYAFETGDGEVMLAPSTGVEFADTALPSCWTSTTLVTGGGTTVAVGRCGCPAPRSPAPRRQRVVGPSRWARR